MKFIKYMAIAATALTLGSCNEEPVLPPVNIQQPTTTIKELKNRYWQNEANYVRTVGRFRDGSDVIVKGRVISSDAAGNVYRSLMISDGECAITIAAKVSNLSDSWKPGQEVTFNCTGLQIGGYNGLMQLGGEGTYNNQPSMTFMEADTFNLHIQGIGQPDPAKIDTIATDLAELSNAKGSQEGLIAWQSQLVRIEGLTFENAGEQFAPSGNTNRYMRDSNGNRINLRCSSYAKFAKDKIPSGTGTVTAILSYFGSDWQLILNGLDGLKGFDGLTPDDPDVPVNPDGGNGSADKPYSVSEAIANQGKTGVWTKGYIVGAMANVNDNYVFQTSDFTVNSNFYIAESKDEKDQAKMMPVQLPAGDVRTALNLVDHSELLGQEVEVYGNLESYFRVPGIKSVTQAKIDGKEVGKPAEPVAGVTFTLATTLADGTYAFWAENMVGVPIDASKTHDYLQVTACTPSGNTISAPETSGFIFKLTDNGWTIQQSTDNRYLIMAGDYNSFNLAENATDAYCYWNIELAADGTATITNAATGKTMQYSAQYKSYGIYPDTRGTKPVLYKR